MPKSVSLKTLAKQAGAGGKVIIVPMGNMRHMGALQGMPSLMELGKGGVVEESKRKRQPTAYNRFVQAHMAEVKARQPDSKLRFKELGAMWKSLTKDQQMSYKS